MPRIPRVSPWANMNRTVGALQELNSPALFSSDFVVHYQGSINRSLGQTSDEIPLKNNIK